MCFVFKLSLILECLLELSNFYLKILLKKDNVWSDIIVKNSTNIKLGLERENSDRKYRWDLGTLINFDHVTIFQFTSLNILF